MACVSSFVVVMAMAPTVHALKLRVVDEDPFHMGQAMALPYDEKNVLLQLGSEVWSENGKMKKDGDGKWVVEKPFGDLPEGLNSKSPTNAMDWMGRARERELALISKLNAMGSRGRTPNPVKLTVDTVGGTEEVMVNVTAPVHLAQGGPNSIGKTGFLTDGGLQKYLASTTKLEIPDFDKFFDTQMDAEVAVVAGDYYAQARSFAFAAKDAPEQFARYWMCKKNLYTGARAAADYISKSVGITQALTAKFASKWGETTWLAAGLAQYGVLAQIKDADPDPYASYNKVIVVFVAKERSTLARGAKNAMRRMVDEMESGKVQGGINVDPLSLGAIQDKIEDPSAGTLADLDRLVRSYNTFAIKKNEEGKEMGMAFLVKIAVEEAGTGQVPAGAEQAAAWRKENAQKWENEAKTREDAAALKWSLFLDAEKAEERFHKFEGENPNLDARTSALKSSLMTQDELKEVIKDEVSKQLTAQRCSGDQATR